MGARTKLNAAYLNGGILIAACVGALTQSWSVFFVALVTLLAGCVYAGEIRGRGRRR